MGKKQQIKLCVSDLYDAEPGSAVVWFENINYIITRHPLSAPVSDKP